MKLKEQVDFMLQEKFEEYCKWLLGSGGINLFIIQSLSLLCSYYTLELSHIQYLLLYLFFRVPLSYSMRPRLTEMPYSHYI